MKGKVKIVHVLQQKTLSGAPKAMFEILKKIDYNKFYISVICQEAGEITEALENIGIQSIYTIPALRREINPFRDVKALFLLYKNFRKNSYQIVHTHSTKAGFLGRIGAYLARIPVVIHTVQGFIFHEFSGSVFNKIFITIEKLGALVTDRIISVNEFDRRLAIDKSIAPPEKIIKIPNGIDLQEYNLEIDIKAKRKELGITENDEAIIGMVARLCEQKDPETFVRAARYVLKKKPQARFLLVGDGKKRDELIKLAIKLNIEDRIIFTGWRKDVRELLKLIDVIVLPSLWEGIPLILLEAMALKVPIVASNIKGNKELIKHDVTGLLVSPKSAEEFSEAIISLLENTNYAFELVKNARLEVEKKYDIKVIAGEISKIYETSLAQYKNREKKI